MTNPARLIEGENSEPAWLSGFHWFSGVPGLFAELELSVCAVHFLWFFRHISIAKTLQEIGITLGLQRGGCR